jgi:hypothetical protein
MTVQRFVDAAAGEILVPLFVVTPGYQDHVAPAPASRVSPPELLTAVGAYNAEAPDHLQAVGTSPSYRQIRPPGWPPGMRTHYEFRQTIQQLAAELHIETDAARPLSELLRAFAGKPVAGGASTLIWDQTWSAGRGRLAAPFSLDAASQDVAQAMRDLINLTFDATESRLRALYNDSKTERPLSFTFEAHHDLGCMESLLGRLAA